MGWKNVKEYYRIGHHVTVEPGIGICIGSSYIHNIVIVGLDGQILKRDDGRANEDIRRYQQEFDADPLRLRELIETPDTFERSIPVYTYDGGNILEKQCTEVGWPNVTHDGLMMYENTFSTDRNRVIQMAIREAKAGIKLSQSTIQELQERLTKAEAMLLADQQALEKLKAETTA